MLTKISTFIVVIAGALVSLLSAETAFAGFDIYDDTVSQSDTLNGSSLRIPGAIMARTQSAQQAGQYQASVYATAGNCLRLEVFYQTVDTTMVVVAPNGAVFRNEDQGAAGDGTCPLCPLIKIIAPKTGWYTVIIGEKEGSPVEADVKYFYGRYASSIAGVNNRNCLFTTQPLVNPPPVVD